MAIGIPNRGPTNKTKFRLPFLTRTHGVSIIHTAIFFLNQLINS